MQNLTKKLFGKLFADRGYISQGLFETLFNNGIHLVTGIKSNMKNRLLRSILSRNTDSSPCSNSL
jgi:hypothetical protein